MTSTTPIFDDPDQALLDGLSRLSKLGTRRMCGFCAQYPEPELTQIRSTIVQALQDGADPTAEDAYMGPGPVQPLHAAMWGCDHVVIQALLEKIQSLKLDQSDHQVSVVGDWVHHGTKVYAATINGWGETEDFKRYWQQYLQVGHIVFKHRHLVQEQPDNVDPQDSMFYQALDAANLFETPDRLVDVLEVMLQYIDQQVVLDVAEYLIKHHEPKASQVVKDCLDEAKVRLSKTNLKENISNVTGSDRTTERKAKI